MLDAQMTGADDGAQETGARPSQESRSVRWTFLSNHGHVLVCIATDPDVRLRDIADAVGITERATFNIVDDLVEGGYLRRTREGRRNRYELHPDLPLRHPIERGHTIGELLNAVAALPHRRR